MNTSSWSSDSMAMRLRASPFNAQACQLWGVIAVAAKAASNKLFVSLPVWGNLQQLLPDGFQAPRFCHWHLKWVLLLLCSFTVTNAVIVESFWSLSKLKVVACVGIGSESWVNIIFIPEFASIGHSQRTFVKFIKISFYSIYYRTSILAKKWLFT